MFFIVSEIYVIEVFQQLSVGKEKYVFLAESKTRKSLKIIQFARNSRFEQNCIEFKIHSIGFLFQAEKRLIYVFYF